MANRTAFFALAILMLSGCAVSEIFFQEDFNDADWADRWVESSATTESGFYGTLDTTAGEKFYHDEADKGLKTMDDARHYAFTSKFSKTFDNKDQTLVLQFSVKHEQKIDCGGAYIKILPETLNQEKFDGDSDYNVMFGPDICGSSTKRTHLIFTYKGENLLKTNDIRCEDDKLTHLYTLVLNADNTFKVLIDEKEVESGGLADGWSFLKPKTIKDPELSKPEDWVDDKEMPDPEDVKPEGHDDIPAKIPDPEAEKPEDWDEEDDGEWEPPMIDNAEYKGEWSAKIIDNPDYKGEWTHPMIDNPEYVEDDALYHFENMGHVGFEIWQVKAGTIFDNIIVTNSEEDAKEFAKNFADNQAAEKKMNDKQEEEKRAKEEEERKKLEEERKEKEAEEAAAAEEEADADEDEAEEEEEIDEEADEKEEL